MITWMQRHKKWLVITIWISVIAFVGAGFVGWGDYDFNTDRSSSLAKVADEKVSPVEFRHRYAQIFSYYQELNNGTLTEQQAKERGLDALALQTLIDDKLLISFAKKLGIGVSDDEILRVLISDENFMDQNGLFDKNLYYSILAQNNIKTTQYEQMIADQILLKKLSVLFNVPVSNEDLEMLAANFFMQDVLSIELIKADKLSNSAINEEELQKFWNERKNDYKTEKRYELMTYFMPLDLSNIDENSLQSFYEANKYNYKDFTGKILPLNDVKDDLIKDYAFDKYKNEANVKYMALNKGEDKFQKDINVSEFDVFFPLQILRTAKPGDVLRPFKFKENGKDGYMIAKVKFIDNVRTKSFEEAREEILPSYISFKSKEILQEKATKALENFKGKNIGTVSRDTSKDSRRVPDTVMNDAEFSIFLMNVFNQDKKKSFVLFDDKAILYEIKDQTLLNTSKMEQYKNNLKENLASIKASLLKENLLKKLKQEQKIEIYYKGN